MTNDYSGLATRIEALATRLVASPATSPTTPTAPATPGSPVVPIVQIEPPVTTPKLESPADPVAQTALGKPASSVSASAGSTLFGAFEELMKLLKSLKPGADQTASASAPPSLTSFLHNLARGLDADRSAPSMTAVGMVINITA